MCPRASQGYPEKWLPATCQCWQPAVWLCQLEDLSLLHSLLTITCLQTFANWLNFLSGYLLHRGWLGPTSITEQVLAYTNWQCLQIPLNWNSWYVPVSTQTPINNIAYKILVWLKISFEFFSNMLWKTQTNFLANPIYPEIDHFPRVHC